MGITATSKYDLKTVTALVRLGAFKKHNPKKIMIGFIFTDFILLILLGFIGFPIKLVCLCAALILLQCYIYLWLPKVQYRAMGKFADSYHTFKFTDDSVSITSSVGGSNDSCSASYDMFYKVMETGEYLFIFLNKRQAHIVDKSTLQGGTVDELRTKFTEIPGMKYIRCNY